jgi:hypothetical protein
MTETSRFPRSAVFAVCSLSIIGVLMLLVGFNEAQGFFEKVDKGRASSLVAEE